MRERFHVSTIALRFFPFFSYRCFTCHVAKLSLKHLNAITVPAIVLIPSFKIAFRRVCVCGGCAAWIAWRQPAWEAGRDIGKTRWHCASPNRKQYWACRSNHDSIQRRFSVGEADATRCCVSDLGGGWVAGHKTYDGYFQRVGRLNIAPPSFI